MTGSEISHMGEVDRNPKVHEDSSPAEQEILRETYGKPDESGLYRGEEETE